MLSVFTLFLSISPLVTSTAIEHNQLRVRQALSCGIAGYDKGSPQAYYYSTKDSVSTLSRCASQCAKKSKCKSYAFGEGACLLYTSAVASNIDLQASSPFQFFDKYCSASPSGTPPLSAGGSSRVNSGSAEQPSSPPTPGTGICGTRGYDFGNPTSFQSSTKKAYRTAEGCSKLCISKSQCRAFAIEERTCLLYDSAVTGNLETVSNSPFSFYDITCFVAAPPASTSFPATATSDPGSASSSELASASYALSREDVTTSTLHETLSSTALTSTEVPSFSSGSSTVQQSTSTNSADLSTSVSSHLPSSASLLATSLTPSSISVGSQVSSDTISTETKSGTQSSVQSASVTSSAEHSSSTHADSSSASTRASTESSIQSTSVASSAGHSSSIQPDSSVVSTQSSIQSTSVASSTGHGSSTISDTSIIPSTVTQRTSASETQSGTPASSSTPGSSSQHVSSSIGSRESSSGQLISASSSQAGTSTRGADQSSSSSIASTISSVAFVPSSSSSQGTYQASSLGSASSSESHKVSTTIPKSDDSSSVYIGTSYSHSTVIDSSSTASPQGVSNIPTSSVTSSTEKISSLPSASLPSSNSVNGDHSSTSTFSTVVYTSLSSSVPHALSEYSSSAIATSIFETSSTYSTISSKDSSSLDSIATLSASPTSSPSTSSYSASTSTDPSSLPRIELKFVAGQYTATNVEISYDEITGQTILNYAPSGDLNSASLTLNLPADIRSLAQDGSQIVYQLQAYIVVVKTGGGNGKRDETPKIDCSLFAQLNQELMVNLEMSDIDPNADQIPITSDPFSVPDGLPSLLRLELACDPDSPEYRLSLIGPGVIRALKSLDPPSPPRVTEIPPLPTPVPPANTLCGVYGWDAEPSGSYATKANAEDCYRYCEGLGPSKCLSFSFYPWSGRCWIFPKKVEGYILYNTPEKAYYYDMQCFAAAVHNACGVLGYDNDPSGALTRSGVATPEDCSNICSNTAGCISFVLSSGNCWTYPKKVQSYVYPNPGGKQLYYYNLGCFDKPTYRCGAEGFSSMQPYYSFNKGGDSISEACRRDCWDRPKCKSFSVTYSTTKQNVATCRQYTDLVSSYIGPKKSARGNPFYWDLQCYIPIYGVSGWDYHPTDIRIAPNLAACKKLCDDTSSCWSYSLSTNWCYMFADITAVFLVTSPNNPTNLPYYDKKCGW